MAKGGQGSSYVKSEGKNRQITFPKGKIVILVLLSYSRSINYQVAAIQEYISKSTRECQYRKIHTCANRFRSMIQFWKLV